MWIDGGVVTERCLQAGGQDEIPLIGRLNLLALQPLLEGGRFSTQIPVEASRRSPVQQQSAQCDVLAAARNDCTERKSCWQSCVIGLEAMVPGRPRLAKQASS
jgi:hypothetical protein